MGMKQDKAIEKVYRNKVVSLPDGFEERIMNRVCIEAKKRSKRNFVLNMALISGVSIVIILGTFYFLKFGSGYNILEHFSFSFFSEEQKPVFFFSSFIASLILGLLALDHTLRELLKKTKSSH
jgi:hypothetical protein